MEYILVNVLWPSMEGKITWYSSDLPLGIFLKEEQFPELDDHMEKMSREYGLRLCRLNSLWEFQELHPEIEAIFMGTRRIDPKGEDLKYFSKTTQGWPDYVLVHPLLDWNYSQIWEYLINNQVKFCRLYAEGYTSLGIPSKTQKKSTAQKRNGLPPRLVA